MLTITHLHRRFGSQTIFDGASWFVGEHERVGLVGPNGAGKSTLLRLISGLDQPDDGLIILPRGATVGYLPQEVLGVSGRTVIEEALGAFADVLELERECRRLEQALSEHPPDDPEYASILEAYTAVRERWDHEGSYDHESQARAVLSGLGFRESDFHRDAGEFSGGWQMRLALARLLLRTPSLLLLDEPTNHLDLEARNWLEQFLLSYPSSVVLVAHDRYFLDVAVSRITEVSRGRLTDYQTTYSHYLVEREERRLRDAEAYRDQQEEIARIESFISRFRYQASKAALVQSRIKQLEKIERLPPPEGGPPEIHFRFPPCERSGRIVLELAGVTKRYDELTVYENLDLTIERGRRVALVGPNGAGKSTLIRILAGVEPLTSGVRRLGHNVTTGYFAQDQSGVLAPEKSVLEEITEAAPYEMAPQIRQLLAAFLFSGDTVYKKTKVLSGGERNRLALAKLLLQPSNCLLLDEPTNHLDIAAKEVLLEALQSYQGTIVIVAHDRYVLDHLPEEVLEVGSGHATRYLGNYEDYLLQKEAEAGADAGLRYEANRREAAVEEPRGGGGEPTGRDRSREEAARQKREARQATRREREMAQLEAEIATREDELARVGARINDPEFYQKDPNPQSAFSLYARLKKDVETLYGKLERLERQAEPAGA